jgi:hypothetical protein
VGGRQCDTEQTDSDRRQPEAADSLCQSRNTKYSGAESALDDWVRHDGRVVSNSNQHKAPFRKPAFGYTIGRSIEGVACILI